MNTEIVDSFAAMVREKSVDKDVLAGIIEEIFGLLVKKKYGPDANFDVVVNMDKGDIEIFLERTIVEEVEDPNLEISIDEVNERGNEDELEVGDDFVEKIPLAAFGRRLINLARQSLNQRIREIEKELIYNEYNEMVGDIVVGDIYQVRRNDVLVNHNKNELLLPRYEQIPREKYRKGDTVREIYDGVIEIKGIAREPGERAKVAVESQDQRIDAVGACVGMKGVRIHAIVRELNNENIDVINYSEDPVIYIQRALSPAKLKSIELDEDEKKCVVTADSDQVSLIVGRNGVNIRLAMKLTGYDIEVIREEKPFEEYEDDIELVELREELGDTVVDLLINNRYDTAVEVLTAGVEKLKEIEGITEETANGIIEILKNQFEEEE
jgi:N utilization substance protein A